MKLKSTKAILILIILIMSVSFSLSFATKYDEIRGHVMTREEYDGFYALYRDGEGEKTSRIITKLYIDGKVGFCLEPDKSSGPYVEGFVEENFSDSGYSDEIQNKLSKIVYCGWTLSDKSLKDYMTTKFMIWQSLGWEITELEGPIDFFEYEQKKKNVLKRIEKLEKKPSFHNKTYTIPKGSTKIINDENKVLSSLFFKDNESSNSITLKGNNIKKEGNELIVTANGESFSNGELTLVSVPRKYQGASLVYYKSEFYQRVGVFKVMDPIYSSIGIKVAKSSGKIKLIKYNSDESKVLKGAVYEIRNSNGKVVDKIISDSKGYSYSKDLPIGDYTITEIKAPSGYARSKYVWKRSIKAAGESRRASCPTCR